MKFKMIYYLTIAPHNRKDSMLIKYTPPKTLKELQDFSKFQYDIMDEEWRPISLSFWENYEISNYGRIRNIDTGKFKKIAVPSYKIEHIKNCNINSIRYPNFIKNDKGDKKIIHETVCDLMLHAFHPDIYDTHINPIPKDNNKFNLSLKNIKYIPNAYFKGDDTYREKYIYINGEKTKYTIDTNGVIINQKKNKELLSSNGEMKANDDVNLSHKGVHTSRTLVFWLSRAFIPNPYNLRYVIVIDSSITQSKLSNVYLTNRNKRGDKR